MSLSEWLARGWLTEHKTSLQEISDLFAVADRDLRDCQAAGLSPDARLAIAHNAALQLAAAALSASGYRASREAYHLRTLQSLAFTVKADARVVRSLDAFRKKRNVSDYERAGLVSDQEAEEMLGLARALRTDVGGWLRSNYPELWPGDPSPSL